MLMGKQGAVARYIGELRDEGGLKGTDIANIADAVNQNPHNTGQVLIYPYYTTRGGVQGVNDYDTILTIVNTAAESKAGKGETASRMAAKEKATMRVCVMVASAGKRRGTWEPHRLQHDPGVGPAWLSYSLTFAARC